MTESSYEKATAGFQLRSSIPVLRMLDESRAKSFYIDFLGFVIDWEHRFRDDKDSPLYMQVSQGASVLHLNGHANSDSPICEVRIPVVGLQNYCDYLCSKRKTSETPEVVDPRYEGRNTDMNIVDPSGNLLVFWAPSEDS